MGGKIMSRKEGKIQHGSLFSGIGGFDLAAHWCGWENAFHCEISEFCNTILKHYWPQAEAIKDIRDYDWKKWKGKIDVLSGGFPCQPYSVAGKRLGKDDPRHLWPEMLRAVRQLRPRWVVGENVRGLLSWNEGMVFHEVQSDLEAEGYEVLPFLLPAAGVNAPHRRERIWFIGCRKNQRRATANTNHRQQQEQPQRGPVDGRSTPESWSGLGIGPGSGDIEGNIAKGIRQLATGAGALLSPAADSHICKRCKGWVYSFQSKETERKPCQCPAWDVRDAWEKFPTQSPLCDGNDGVSAGLDGITFPKWRTESIKAGGNAIVPQVAFQIFRAIDEMLRIYH
jgi:DNA (cytosine-5)-methyltransferase 1